MGRCAGDIDRALYIKDCVFADPTIQFRGLDKYQRNLKALTSFFDEPRIELFDVQTLPDGTKSTTALQVLDFVFRLSSLLC